MKCHVRLSGKMLPKKKELANTVRGASADELQTIPTRTRALKLVMVLRGCTASPRFDHNKLQSNVMLSFFKFESWQALSLLTCLLGPLAKTTCEKLEKKGLD